MDRETFEHRVSKLEDYIVSAIARRDAATTERERAEAASIVTAYCNRLDRVYKEFEAAHVAPVEGAAGYAHDSGE